MANTNYQNKFLSHSRSAQTLNLNQKNFQNLSQKKINTNNKINDIKTIQQQNQKKQLELNLNNSKDQINKQEISEQQIKDEDHVLKLKYQQFVQNKFLEIQKQLKKDEVKKTTPLQPLNNSSNNSNKNISFSNHSNDQQKQDIKNDLNLHSNHSSHDEEQIDEQKKLQDQSMLDSKESDQCKYINNLQKGSQLLKYQDQNESYQSQFSEKKLVNLYHTDENNINNNSIIDNEYIDENNNKQNLIKIFEKEQMQQQFENNQIQNSNIDNTNPNFNRELILRQLDDDIDQKLQQISNLEKTVHNNQQNNSIQRTSNQLYQYYKKKSILEKTTTIDISSNEDSFQEQQHNIQNNKHIQEQQKQILNNNQNKLNNKLLNKKYPYYVKNYENSQLKRVETLKQELMKRLDQQENKINRNLEDKIEKQLHRGKTYQKINDVRSKIEQNKKPDILEQFKLGITLGIGSYATCKLAINQETQQKFAIKIYDKLKLFDPQKKKNVQREINILSKLDHPNIIKMIKQIENSRTINIVMEYIGDKSLYQFLKEQKNRKLDEKTAKKIFFQLISALQYLHDKNISHRDIKMENILLDENQNIKLIDFGFAIILPEFQKLNIFCGTPCYMSPELVNKQHYFGAPADIWAAGILLYVMLAGNFPFHSNNDKMLYEKIKRTNYIIPQDFPTGAQNVLKKILVAKPENRVTANQILNDTWLKPVDIQEQIIYRRHKLGLLC
ncbi:Protein kinase-like domain [Pseudocohnilembus persalinus]|uniref:Protein kinase-like domain n=1 Tax=Pseudocohnilembus persalinus TaxID=266149 RepID=A0A0V0R478_PSEPJ|nr:Protein kinase-like domain [Pseudocohnilembus persalinus]|eukprot:KRX09291.1 Protein kinase-like domain [Pseudocohnilembus persalinus]